MRAFISIAQSYYYHVPHKQDRDLPVPLVPARDKWWKRDVSTFRRPMHPRAPILRFIIDAHTSPRRLRRVVVAYRSKSQAPSRRFADYGENIRGTNIEIIMTIMLCIDYVKINQVIY